MKLAENLGARNLWQQPIYARFLEEIDPFETHEKFRPIDRAYDGNLTFWERPSPEPNLPDEFWQQLQTSLGLNPAVQEAGARLAGEIAMWEPNPNQLLFVSILRAGVPIADWLCRLLPGSVSVSVSLFTGLGIDQVALAAVRSDYPDRRIVFVDGWTGRGGVARELAKLEIGPLAVLIDPWGVADFAGSFNDLFCPSACFTGVSTLGFSRTFYRSDTECFSAYLFPTNYLRPELVTAWQQACPTARLEPLPRPIPFFASTDLRIHSNEVCRALINADPKLIYFSDDEHYVQDHYGLILSLAERRHVNVVYHYKYLGNFKTKVACSF